MKPGPKPKGKTPTKWSSKLAYAIGLIAADGCLSGDGRHFDLTSIDKEQIILFKKCLNLKTKISKKYSGNGNLAYHTQFGDVLFYKFLNGLGLTAKKSKTIGKLKIPKKYFFDFLRGYFDGDGCSYSYYDRVFPKSYRFYISFTSASPKYFDWLRSKLAKLIKIKGHIARNKNYPYIQLKYSKKEAVILSKAMYHRKKNLYLKRKHLKIIRSLSIIN
jgi:hypothetical protein